MSNNPVGFIDPLGLKTPRPPNPWNVYQQQNPGRTSTENAQNYRQEKMNNMSPNGSNHPTSNLPDRSNQRNTICMNKSSSCYYEMLCDWECYQDLVCGARGPRKIRAVSQKPQGECTLIICYWKYQ